MAAKRDLKQALALGAPIEEATAKLERFNAKLTETESFGNRLKRTFKDVAAYMSGKGPTSDNRVAPAPTFTTTTAAQQPAGQPRLLGPNGQPLPPSGGGGTTPPPTAPGDNPTGAGGGGGFSRYMSSITGGTTVGAMALGGYQIASNALPSQEQFLQQDLLTSRAGFYGLGGAPGGSQAAYGNVLSLQRDLLRRGLVSDPLEATRGIVRAQNLGMAGGGGGQFSTFMQGMASASIATPGLGVEGAVSAYSDVYSAANSNQLLTAGIRLRNADGTLRPISDVADDIWSMLNRVKTKSGKITVGDLNTQLTPGFTLARFLDFYFGPNTAARKNLVDMLFLKAQKDGAKISSINMGSAQETGAVTGAVASISERAAEAGAGIGMQAQTAVKGIEAANEVATGLNKLSQAASDLIGPFAAFSNFMGTTGGIGKGSLGKLLSGIPLIGSLFKAEGGPVEKQNAYIVGERGPELFVPKESGTIIPNHQLNVKDLNFAGFRADGGEVTPKGFATDLIKGLGGTPTKGALDALITWMRFEGGHWRNTADFNPLNTTLNMPGSRPMNSVGVEAYANYQQGLEATIKTLTGANAKGRGYTDIVNAIKTGDRDAILKAVNNSAWRTGKAGGAGSYKGLLSSDAGTYGDTTERTKGAYSGSGSNTGSSGSDSKYVAPTPSFSRQLTGPVAGDFGKSEGGTTINLGGVNITVQGDKDPKATAKMVKDILLEIAKDKKLGTK